MIMKLNCWQSVNVAFCRRCQISTFQINFIVGKTTFDLFSETELIYEKSEQATTFPDET